MNKMIACLAVQAVLAGAAFAQQPPMQTAPAPGTTPGSGPTSPAAPQLGGVELKAALCQIDGILSPMDGVPVPAAEASLCQPFFSIENVSTYIAASKGSDLDFAALGNALVLYYEMRALAFGGAQQCGPLANLQAAAEKTSKYSMTVKSDWESNCRTHYSEIRFVQALVTRDPKAAELCQAWDASDPNRENGKDGKGGESGELCRRAAAASDLKAFGDSVCNGKPAGVRKCVDFFHAISGDSSACHGLSSEAVSHRDLCPGYVSFAKAGPAKNPALCGGNIVCLAMTGSAVRSTVDAQIGVAAALGPVLLPDAQARLKKVAASVDPNNEAVAKELESRAERIAALRLKNQPSSRKSAPIHPVKKGASNAQEER